MLTPYTIKRYLKTCQLIALNFPHASWSNKKIHRKRIIICMDGKTNHGGFVDRLKGIISFYEVAKATNRDFFIYHTDPFELEGYLNKNQMDWRLKNGFHWNIIDTHFLVAYNRFDFNPFEAVSTIESQTILVYSNVDYTHLVTDESPSSTHQLRWKDSFEELFVFNTSLIQKAASILFKKAYHTRFTSLLGDFKDTTDQILNDKEQLDLMNRVLMRMKTEAQACENDILVFSDSNKFLNFVRQNSFFKVLEGAPVHMDHAKASQNTVEDQHEKTILDFLLLSQAQEVCLFQLDAMYNSNFSKFASYVGSSTFHKITG